MEEIYGEGNTTVPGRRSSTASPSTARARSSRGSRSSRPTPALYPEPIADAVREAERWGDGELQDLGRRLPWGALHFRPEAMGTFGGGGPLDPAGTDFAIRFVRATWKYHEITAERLADDLAGLPAKIAHIERAGRRRAHRRREAERGRPADRRDDPRPADRRRPAAAARGPPGRADRAALFPDYAGRGPRRRVPGRLGLTSGSAGPGVSAAATQTSAKARIRRTSCAVLSGSGSPKTIGPAAIVTTLPAALVMAMTATVGPSCSERAETTRPTRLSSRMTSASGCEQDAGRRGRAAALQRLDRDVAGAPQQAGGEAEHRAGVRGSPRTARTPRALASVRPPQ